MAGQIEQQRQPEAREFGPDEPAFVSRFYYSSTFPYLIAKWKDEIERRLKSVPLDLRRRKLVPRLAPMGEVAGDVAWQVFRDYLDAIEWRVAEIVGRHSPGFWFHLHRRLRPMLVEAPEYKTDDTTVILVRRVAELAYAKHGNLGRTDDLGPILRTRLETFLDGAWYEATAQELRSKLKAKKEYQRLKWSKQVVATDFRVSDLWDVFGIEGLCQEYWWASAVMRAIGKDSIVRWEEDKTPPLRYKDNVNPLCFNHYDARTGRQEGFGTRLGTWMHAPEAFGGTDVEGGDVIHFAQVIPNPQIQEYPVWNSASQSIGRGLGATNFGMGTFSLARFKAEHGFMAAPFKDKHGVELDVVLFAIWSASFFAVFTGFGRQLLREERRTERTMVNWTNLLFRGYTMVNLNLDQFAEEAVWWATQLQQDPVFSVQDVRRGVEFISLSERAQKTIGLWSGGKRPILIPSVDGLMIDLAAIMPFIETIFFGIRKVPQVGGGAFEDSVRTALAARRFEICLKGELRWVEGSPREVDAGVRIGDQLLLLECFTYELPLDYEVGKPSVFANRRKYIEKKVEQARSLAERLSKEPRGTNFDVSWAKQIDWRVISPFVEFAWHFKEPLFDGDGVPRVLAVSELVDYLVNGAVPAASYLPILKKLRDFEPQGRWY